MIRLPDRDFSIVGAFSCVFVAALWAAGWTSPWVAPDAEGYLTVAPYPEFFFSHRLPFYGWLAAAMSGHQPLIWLQLILHVAAAGLLYAAMRRLGTGHAAAISVFLSALFSQAFLIFGRGTHPEAPAISLALIALAATLLAIPGVPWKRYAALAGASGALAILLRPILAPLIVTAPLLLIVASRATGRTVSLVRPFALLLAMALPLVAYAAERARHTGDFKLLAYGGFQMSGIAALMLSEDIVQRFPAAERDFAAQILAARERAEAAGRVTPTRFSSKRQRSFLSAAVGYFDVYADSYDRLIHGDIQDLRRPGESWISFDARLQRFTFTTIRLAPAHYAAWVIGATSRLVGRMIATNAPFLLASLALLVALLAMLWRPDAFHNLRSSKDTLLLVAVVGSYVLTTAPLAVLVTFPASRYIDSAAVLLPALPLYGAIRLFAALRARPSAD